MTLLEEALTEERLLEAWGKVLANEGGPGLTLVNWQPLIGPSRIVNTSGSISSQIGVAVWQADRDLDWPIVSALRLTVSKIGGQAVRTFTWTTPRLLLDVQ